MLYSNAIMKNQQQRNFNSSKKKTINSGFLSNDNNTFNNYINNNNSNNNISIFNNSNPFPIVNNSHSYYSYGSNNNSFSNNNFSMINNNPKQMSIQILHSLLSKNCFVNTLNPSKEINYDNFTRLPSELANVNYHLWIDKFKSFLTSNFLEELIADHDNNIISINQILSVANVQLISTIPEKEPNDLLDKLDTFLTETNSFMFNNYNSKNQFTLFSNSYQMNNNNNNNSNNHNNIASSHNTNEYQINNSLSSNSTLPQLKVFFGDTTRLVKIIQLIDYKLKTYIHKDRDIPRDSPYNLPSNQFNQNLNLDYNVSYNEAISSIIKQHNPFTKKNTSMDYRDILNTNKIYFRENMQKLKQLLLYRIILNEKLLVNSFIKWSLNEKQTFLRMEYVISRIRELRNNINEYKNNSGGMFLNENWFSAFPTDSQIIAFLCIKYMEDVYKEHYMKNKLLLMFPLTPNLQQGSYQLYIYQINPHETEPYFCVIYDDMIIPCEERDNFFHCFVIFLYLMKVLKHKVVNDLNLGEFIQKIII